MHTSSIILISTADWDHPLWTNKQHVACSLADMGFRVLYVESLGIRPIRMKSNDFLRIFRRLCRAFKILRKVRPRVWVCSPLVIPSGNNGLALRLNKISLKFALSLCRFLLSFRDPLLWTYNPLTARFISLKGHSLIVYHAVDALQEQPDMPSKLISQEEKYLCSVADQVFVTSPKLEAALMNYSRHLRFDPNVADYSHFSRALDFTSQDYPIDLVSIPEPRIGFMGAISSYKIDISLIAELAQTHPEWNFVFIGPIGEGESITDISVWSTLDNIHCLGAKSYSVLPNYCAGFQCGILPLTQTAYSESMFPMKFFEYLASGLPIVATSIPSLKEFSSVAFLANPDVNSFSSALDSCINGLGATLEDRLSVAKKHTYTARTAKMLQCINDRYLEKFDLFDG